MRLAVLEVSLTLPFHVVQEEDEATKTACNDLVQTQTLLPGELSAPNHKSQIASDFKSRSSNRKNIPQIAVKNASNRSSNRVICDLKSTLFISATDPPLFLGLDTCRDPGEVGFESVFGRSLVGFSHF